MTTAPSTQAGSYAFGRFSLSADGTLLVRDGEPVALAPKVLQTLRTLVERAGTVVRKDDLMQAVWGDTCIEETGLARNVSLLRQALGDQDQTLIVTVPRVGYRFTGSVRRADGNGTRPGEDRRRPDQPANAAAYEYYLRGNEAIGPQGISSSANLRVARALYGQAIEEDPRFAPAWARLGRCHYLIGKVDQGDEPGAGRGDSLARAEACFRKALEISPDLDLAHDLAALVEIDQGRARDAMVRLLARARGGADRQPQLFASLIQACRYCGLLEASVAAHYRARALDPEMATGGYQSLWQLGDEEGALREGRRPYLIRAIVTGMRGDPAQAIELLRDLEARNGTALIGHLAASVRGVFEQRRELALEHAARIWDTSPDPEYWVFVSRTAAAFGDARVFGVWERALDAGYVPYRLLLRQDPWLDPLRPAGEFRRILDRSRVAYRASREAYRSAGGEALLGAVPDPEELERGG